MPGPAIIQGGAMMALTPMTLERAIPKFCPRCGEDYETGTYQAGIVLTDWIVFRCKTPNCQPPEIEFAYRIAKPEAGS
jgi:uncharacterized protein (UPF0212 family)